MQLQKQITRRLHDEHEAVFSLAARVMRAFAGAAAESVPDLAAPPWNALLRDLHSALEFEIAGHFDIEERALFPLLAEAGAGDLVGILDGEHRAIRAVAAPVIGLLQKSRNAGLDAADWRALRALGLDLCERLEAHAHKEEIAMLPALEMVLEDERDRELIASYANGRQTRLREAAMASNAGSAAGSLELRQLAPADLDAVVAIDAGLIGRRRQVYFRKRLDAALGQPKLHAQFAAVRNGVLSGYVLARRLAGEFGGTEPALRLEVIGVRPELRGQGIGRRLLAELEAWGRRRAVREARTLATWRDHDMLHFLDRAGFHLGGSQVVDCAVHAGPIGGLERVAGPLEEARAPERNYGAPVANDFEALARDRADVRLLARDDLPAILAIDRRVTGRSREGYLTEVMHEALADSGVRVSLVARRDGVTAGFLMAKTDYGDFGRTGPVAVIDTLGVDPEFTGRGIGTALLSQLFLNLHALRVEQIETVIARENTQLLQFFYRAGFAPGQRLEFVKVLSRE